MDVLGEGSELKSEGILGAIVEGAFLEGVHVGPGLGGGGAQLEGLSDPVFSDFVDSLGTGKPAGVR